MISNAQSLREVECICLSTVIVIFLVVIRYCSKTGKNERVTIHGSVALQQRHVEASGWDLGSIGGPITPVLGHTSCPAALYLKGPRFSKKKKKGTTAPAYLGSITFFVVRVVRLLDSHSRERYCTLLRAQESGQVLRTIYLKNNQLDDQLGVGVVKYYQTHLSTKIHSL